MSRKRLKKKLRKIRLLALDVDGVLTDGSIYIDARGLEWKAFHVRDGFAIARAVECGLTVAMLSGRLSAAVTLRAQELGVRHCVQNCQDKHGTLLRLADSLGIARNQIAFVGDDLNDLPAFDAARVRIAVADAVREVRRQADWVTRKRGGRGAAREVIVSTLKAQKLWEGVKNKYAPSPQAGEPARCAKAEAART